MVYCFSHRQVRGAPLSYKHEVGPRQGCTNGESFFAGNDKSHSQWWHLDVCHFKTVMVVPDADFDAASNPEFLREGAAANR